METTLLILEQLSNQNKETIFPGDIIQFEGVKIERKEKGKTVYYETFEHHTAIVYSVEDKNKIKLISPKHWSIWQKSWCVGF